MLEISKLSVEGLKVLLAAFLKVNYSPRIAKLDMFLGLCQISI